MRRLRRDEGRCTGPARPCHDECCRTGPGRLCRDDRGRSGPRFRWHDTYRRSGLRRLRDGGGAGGAGGRIVTQRRGVALAAALLLAGCAVGPDYEALPVDDGQWIAAAEQGGGPSPAPILPRWWQSFDDERLTRLIGEAVERNLSLRAAAAAVREAQAARRGAASALRPQIDGGVEYLRYRLSENSPTAGGQLAAAGVVPRTDEQYEVRFDALWELDVFGATRRRVESATATAQAALAARDATVLTLQAETARSYFELRGAQRRIALAEQNIALQERTLSLVERKVEVGLSRKLDALRARSQLDATRAALPALRAAARAAAYRLALLTARPPEALADELLASEPLPAVPDVVPVGLRSDVLRRRPDLRLAERRVAAAVAEVGAAHADFFPRFALTATGGWQSGQTSTLGDSESVTGALLPFVSVPLFRGGALRANLAAADARAEIALVQYEEAMLDALREVETALVTFVEARRTRQRLERATASSRDAAVLANRLYEKGLSNFIDVLDAERRVTEIADELAQSETRVLLSLAALYKALGGGWEQTSAATAPQTASAAAPPAPAPVAAVAGS